MTGKWGIYSSADGSLKEAGVALKLGKTTFEKWDFDMVPATHALHCPGLEKVDRSGYGTDWVSFTWMFVCSPVRVFNTF